MCKGGRNPIHCIVPPQMMDRILEKGDAKLRKILTNTLKRDAFIRNSRAQTAQAILAIGNNLLHSFAAATSACTLQRRIYDAQGGESLPGKLMRSEGDPPVADNAVNEVYDGAGNTFDLFRTYGRCSIDNQGMVMENTVHFGQNYVNAFWDGRQMIYGDGDGQLFNRFTTDIDVIGHELAHGVTQYEAALQYQGQSGALNESFSDVFGSLVKQKANGESAKQADWLIGENILVGDPYSLRSLKSPGTAYVNHPILGTDPQPGHMKDYKNLPPWDDHGGVHTNSGIPNRAFYLAAMKIGGNAWEKAGLIWYVALRDSMKPASTFEHAASCTINAAESEFGVSSSAAKAVTEAWKEVGVN